MSNVCWIIYPVRLLNHLCCQVASWHDFPDSKEICVITPYFHIPVANTAQTFSISLFSISFTLKCICYLRAKGERLNTWPILFFLSKRQREKAPGKQNQGGQLKLLIGLLISCTLFDWFAINSGLWCAEDRAWRQPWSPLTPYTHWEHGRGEYQYVAVRLILANSREGHHHLIGAGSLLHTQTIHSLFHPYTRKDTWGYLTDI